MSTRESLLDQETLALIDPAILHREVEIACGQHREDKNFRTIKAPFGQLLDGLLGTFRVGEKDGLCILSGGLVTPGGCQRIAKNVTRNHLMMFDHDTGVPVEDICAKIEALGYFAVVYTTYSHLKPATEVAESQVTKWLQKSGKKAGSDGSITPAQAAEFLSENKKIVPAILADISRVERVMVAGKGVVYRITHAPMPRCRSVLVLKDPFDFAQRGTQAQAIAEWKEKYTYVANLIDGTFDSSCTDPSRLMYTPVKAADAAPGTHEWYVIPGAMVDLDNLPVGENDLFERFRQQGNSEGAYPLELKTPGLAVFLRTYGDDLEAADWLMSVASEDFRKDHGTHQAFRCPNEDAHSEPNPNDLAFVVWNASQREPGHGFHMLCKHDTCITASRERRAWYVDKACQYYGVGVDSLQPFSPRWEAEKEAAEKQRGDLDALLAALTPSAEDAEINAVVRLIAALPPSDAKGALCIDAVREKVKRLTKRQIEDMVRAVRRQMRDEARANDGGNADWHAAPEDRAYATEIWLHWDEDIQKECAEKTFERFNLAESRVFIRPEGDVVVVQEGSEGAPRLKRADDDSAWDLHFETAGIRFKNDRAKTVSAPKAICGRMRASTDLVLPHLDQIVTVPVFSPDGTLRTEKGYDKELKAYLDPSLDFIAPPPKPTEDDIDDAWWWITEAIRDFPFTDNFGGGDQDLPIRLDPPELDEEGFPLPNVMRGRSSRTNFFAALLQPFARALIKGPCPAFHIDKPGAGTGATKLASVISLIFDGKEADPSALSPDQEEIRKALTAHLHAGGNILFFDNINHHVDSGTLAGALTAGTWSDRLLGSSVKTEQRIRCLWIWAGNNVTFSHELMRRNVPIRLDAATPNPARDRGPDWYKHADLEGWIRENRAALVWACHTLIQNWVACGRPAGSARLASFEDWAGVMSGILECAGVPEGVFLGNIAVYQDTKDDEAGAYDALVTAFASLPAMGERAQGLTCTEILIALDKPLDPYNPFRDLGIADLAPDKKAAKLGKLINKHVAGGTFRLPDGRLVKVARKNQTTPSKYGLVPVAG